MLRNLHVKNLALIDELEVDFEQGLNILTGETGAGKSLIIGSIGMALGEKVPKEMIKENADFALAELVFEVTGEEKTEKLKALDIYPEDGLVIMSRKISGGRSIAKINSESVSAAKLREVSELLIDIHGQHEHQSLTQKKHQLALLDEYAKEDIGELKVSVKSSYEAYTAVLRELEEKDLDEEQQKRELSFLEFELQEIEGANLKIGEDSELEEQYQKLVNHKKIMDSCMMAHQQTAGEGDSATEQLGRAVRELSTVSGYDERLQELEEQLAEIDNLLNDFNRELADYMGESEFAEESFYETEKRLDEINHLKSKYGNTIEKILEVKEEKETRVQELQDYDAYLLGLKEREKVLKEELELYSNKLSEMRKKYAKELTALVEEHLKELNFETVRFEMRFEKMDHFTANGTDDAQFLISTNPGEEVKPLGSIASGGEISRIMLALKTVLAENDEIDTLIFDEIDTGISGRTAQKVSEKMNLIGRNHQVICITHLPQIAAMADTHFLIEKQVEGGATHSRIVKMKEEESVEELARMLGGVTITETVLENAREMKNLAAKTKNS
ncbi:MAG: DNA repair protein RecN [Lachnospiraceae bacterium]|nr:DNA repair protein RecN [Lachnospiraceae bacterium]MDD7377691.1 DNA repair protein RecN [Lachnospiraceae bacterium]MDY4616249.1 DNA repair protein RecN [Lachnospiraceae bacterium]